MNLSSFQSNKGSQSVTYSCLDKSQFRKDAQELLVMHKRFEQNAVKRMHTCGGLADLEDHCRRFYGSSSAPNVSSTRSRADKILQRDRKWNLNCLKDNGYLDHLLPKKEHNQRNVKRNEQIESGLLNLRSTTAGLPDRQSNTLRLPKFNSLPPENKQIFYTRLSHIPSLPRFPEIKTQVKQIPKKKATKNRELDFNLFQSAENCLQVRALLRNSAKQNDSEDNKVRFWKTEKTFSLKSAQELFTLQKTNTKEDRSDLTKLSPLSTDEKLIQKQCLSNGRLRDAQKPTNEAPRQPELEVLEKPVVEKLISETEKNNSAECDEVKTKRTVRFSECLREVHVYSPLVSSDKSTNSIS